MVSVRSREAMSRMAIWSSWTQAAGRARRGGARASSAGSERARQGEGWMVSVRSREAISRMAIWSSWTKAMRRAVSASSCSRRARRMRASRDHWRPGKWSGSAMGTEVVLLDGGGEVLDFLRGDVGEGERLDGSRGAGLRMGDGAAVLEGSREGGAGADLDGVGFEGEGGDALQGVSAREGGRLAGGGRWRRPGGFEQRGGGFRPRRRGLRGRGW